VRLAHAPTNPREFQTLARQMAEILKGGAASDPDLPYRAASGANGDAAPAPAVNDVVAG
jgi:hypothetical protein